MRLPEFLQFTPEERRAALALLLFTGGGGLLLEIGRRNPAWVPDLLSAMSRDRVIQPADSTRSAPPGAGGGPTLSDMLAGGRISPVSGRPEAIAAAGDSAPPAAKPHESRADSPGAAEGEEPRSRSRRSSAVKKAPAGPVDLATADAAALMTLPGIGPALAARIVQDREQNGPFRTVDDLGRVKGIGGKTLARLKPYLTAGSP